MKVTSPVLKRIGPVPFWRGEKKCLAELQSIVDKARDSAQLKLSK